MAFEAIGCWCVWSCEKNKAARETYALNFGEEPAGDIVGIDPALVPDHEIAVAGLPCTPYSVAGKRGGFADQRANVLHPVLKIIAHKQPIVVLFENVPTLAHLDGGNILRFVLNCFRGLGYKVSWQILDSSSIGSSQRRRRLYIVGTRDRHFDFGTIRPQPGGCLADILEDVDEGWLDPREYTLIDPPRVRNSGSIFAGYLNKPLRQPGGDLDCPRTHRQTSTIWSATGLGLTFCSSYHRGRYRVMVGDRVRTLTTRERCRLMGFPPDFKFARPARISTQLGNSVSVECVTALARDIARQVFSKPVAVV